MEKYLIGENGCEDEFIKYYYEIGSISKTFTGLLIERAILENKSSMEDSCAKYIPYPLSFYFRSQLSKTIRNHL